MTATATIPADKLVMFVREAMAAADPALAEKFIDGFRDHTAEFRALHKLIEAYETIRLNGKWTMGR